MLKNQNSPIRTSALKPELNRKEEKVKSENNNRSRLIKISFLERMGILLSFILIDLIICYTFFDSLIFVALLLPMYIPFRKIVSSELILKKRRLLKIQFMECLNAMANALDSGYSSEKGIGKAAEIVGILYGDNSVMKKELVRMEGRLRIGVTVEGVWMEFAKRSGLEEAETLADAIVITKRYGGNLSRLFVMLSRMIDGGIRVENEIDVLIASRKYEHLIMCFVPILMVLYMRYTAADIMLVLYTTVIGRVVMLVCLLLYVLAMIIGILLLRKAKFD